MLIFFCSALATFFLTGVMLKSPKGWIQDPPVNVELSAGVLALLLAVYVTLAHMHAAPGIKDISTFFIHRLNAFIMAEGLIGAVFGGLARVWVHYKDWRTIAHGGTGKNPIAFMEAEKWWLTGLGVLLLSGVTLALLDKYSGTLSGIKTPWVEMQFNTQKLGLKYVLPRQRSEIQYRAGLNGAVSLLGERFDQDEKNLEDILGPGSALEKQKLAYKKAKEKIIPIVGPVLSCAKYLYENEKLDGESVKAGLRPLPSRLGAFLLALNNGEYVDVESDENQGR